MTLEARSRSLIASVARALAVTATAVALGGCLTITPADLARLDTHGYPGRSPAQVQHAVDVALKTQGFTIVDEAGGRIKTAPKVVAVNAHGGAYTATAVDSSLAWVIDVTGANDGAKVHAEMRPSQGGRSLQATEVTASYAEALYRDLYREIDSNLGIVSRPVVAAAAVHSGATTTSAAALASPTPSSPPGGGNPPPSAPPGASAGAPPVASPQPEPAPDTTARATSPNNPVRTGASLAGLLGYGFNDALQVGFGVRGGYTLPMKLYVGGMLMYHLGSSQSFAAGGVSGSSHVNVYYGGLEGGYDLGVASVLIRPYAGVGPTWVSVSSESNVGSPVTGRSLGSTSASTSNIGFWIGGTVLYPVSEAIAVGGDARVIVVSDYNTFNLIFTSAYRF